MLVLDIIFLFYVYTVHDSTTKWRPSCNTSDIRKQRPLHILLYMTDRTSYHCYQLSCGDTCYPTTYFCHLLVYYLSSVYYYSLFFVFSIWQCWLQPIVFILFVLLQASRRSRRFTIRLSHNVFVEFYYDRCLLNYFRQIDLRIYITNRTL